MLETRLGDVRKTKQQVAAAGRWTRGGFGGAVRRAACVQRAADALANQVARCNVEKFERQTAAAVWGKQTDAHTGIRQVHAILVVLVSSPLFIVTISVVIVTIVNTSRY